MHKLGELHEVKEEKHLVPNVPLLVKEIFGEDAYFIDWKYKHTFWGKNDDYYPDGMVWLPWKSQLWLIEVEWKLASNFFDQVRAFARGIIDFSKLEIELRQKLKHFEGILKNHAPHYREGHTIQEIIDKTIKNHKDDKYLTPHIWVLLGHQGRSTIKKLEEHYKRSLTESFSGKQKYILSMARLFSNELANYILLENHFSNGIEIGSEIERSILVPVKPCLDNEPGVSANYSDHNSAILSGSTPFSSKNGSLETFAGRAEQFWSYLSKIDPSLSPDQVKLRIQIDEETHHNFIPDWHHPGSEFMVFSNGGQHKKPSNAAKEVFRNKELYNYGNIARRFGTFINSSKEPHQDIVTYRKAEKSIWIGKK